MGITRLGNIALYNNTLSDVAGVQRRLAELQEQISSGIKAKDFRGLNGQVEQFVHLEAKMRTTSVQMENNQLNISRLKTADQAVGQAVDIADRMENLIAQARSGANGTSTDFAMIMRGYLDELGGAMNINFEGRYLFGGTNTSTPPVPNPQFAPQSVGTPDAGYYAGAQQDLVYFSDERTQYEFPIRADDPAFQKIIAAAHAAIQAFASGTNGTPDSAGLGNALDLMQQGQAELNVARARLNSVTLNVEQANETLTSLNLYWKSVTEQVSRTDILAASTEVANNEAILQAAFQVFSRLSQLKLSDYLR
ncbi:MAG: hypothetical protein DI582_05050 [Azospirillum brasilense]|nr:MAG: hypothetical protein DI582_05050 [Azospirillum brasilense]